MKLNKLVVVMLEAVINVNVLESISCFNLAAEFASIQTKHSYATVDQTNGFTRVYRFFLPRKVSAQELKIMSVRSPKIIALHPLMFITA